MAENRDLNIIRTKRFMLWTGLVEVFRGRGVELVALLVGHGRTLEAVGPRTAVVVSLFDLEPKCPTRLLA